MAPSPHAAESDIPPKDQWGSSDDQVLDTMGPVTDSGLPNAPLPSEEFGSGQPEVPDHPSVDGSNLDAKNDSAHEKPVKPNKVYVGGLPDHTRQEDLQSCFGKIGKIVNIELKVGYGFVEFDTREAAEESVAKYHEGFFMGNKIRVELSHNRGRTAKHSSDPGACFKCGQVGHWARECPNHTAQAHHRSGPSSGAPLIDRIHPPRDYPLPPPPPRDYPPYRDDFGPAGRYPPSRDRYGFDYPPPPPPPGRDYRRPLTPPRDFRDYHVGPPMRSSRDYDDFRMRGPPPPLPPSRYDRPAFYPPERDMAGYPPRGYPPPSPRDYYDRYDRRAPPLDDRYPPYPPVVRPRTPPSHRPPRVRDDYDRPPRDFGPPPESRGRPLTPPPHYANYPPRRSSVEPPGSRYRRPSLSPPRSSVPYDSANYSGPSNYTGNGYSSSSGGPPRGGGRDYPPRNGRDAPEAGGSYRRP